MKALTETFQRNKKLAAVLILALAAVSSAFAGTVEGCAAGAGGPTPGNTVLPVDCTGFGPGTLMADMVQTFTYSTTAGTNTGTIESAVYMVDGTLDFYYQVINSPSSATALARLTATDFAGYMTDAGFRTDGSTLSGTTFIDGNTAPVTADSNVDGSVIGFSFYPPSAPPTEIAPGSASYVLVISTDATNYTLGNASIIDGGTDTVSAFQPAAATTTPEPASMGLMGLGLIGIVTLCKRSKSISRLLKQNN
jgi:hypothetical protein